MKCGENIRRLQRGQQFKEHRLKAGTSCTSNDYAEAVPAESEVYFRSNFFYL